MHTSLICEQDSVVHIANLKAQGSLDTAGEDSSSDGIKLTLRRISPGGEHDRRLGADQYTCYLCLGRIDE